MREIKFRAWMLQTQVMLEWDDGSGHGLKNIVGKYLSEPGGHAIIEQYTGLKDANGNEIYESDILQCGSHLYIVKFGHYDNDATDIDGLEHGYGWFGEKIPPDPKDKWTYCGILSFANWAETLSKITTIIGNIHQNPELLREKNEKD